MKKVGIKIQIIIMLIISISLAITIILKSNVKTQIQVSELKSVQKTAPAGLFGDHSGQTFIADGNQQANGGYSTPTIGGLDNVYCTSHGGNIVTEGSTMEEVYAFQEAHPKNSASCSHPGPGYFGEDACPGLSTAPSCAPSKAYYRCVGNHQIINGAFAFLLDSSSGDWSGEVQQAIWNGEIKEIPVDNAMPIKTAEQYEAEGQYAKAEDVRNYNKATNFYDKLIYTEDGSTDAPGGISFGGNTMVDQEKQEYVIGPINIDYIDGGQFGTITNMTVTTDKGTNVNYSTRSVSGTTSTGLPSSGSDFYLAYSDPGEHKSITITVKYEWTEYYTEICRMEGVSYQVAWSCNDPGGNHPWHIHKICTIPLTIYCDEEEDCSNRGERENKETGEMIYWCMGHTNWEHPYHDDDCYYAVCSGSGTAVSKVVTSPQQPVVSIKTISVPREKTYSITIDFDDEYDPLFDIGGNVWEDIKSGKETGLNGTQDDNEPAVSGIPVILHKVDYKTKKEVDTSNTITDKNGNYVFTDLNPMYKYYVEFQYNGQRYENTVYTDNLSGGPLTVNNGDSPVGHSNATESVRERNEFNKTYQEINGDEGYTLLETTDENGKKTFAEYDTYLPENQNYAENKHDMFKISAYTGSDGRDSLKMYPEKDHFTIISRNPTSVKIDADGYTTVVNNIKVEGKNYEQIYSEAIDLLEVDFGITKRIQFDMAVKQDLFIATVKINGKTEVYGYDKRNIGNNEEGAAGSDTWEINEVVSYNRELNNADYNFNGENGNITEKLEVYATYKIAVRNQSQSMLGHVTRLINKYDENFTYQENLSWVSANNYKDEDSQILNEIQRQLTPSSKDTENFKITSVSEGDFKDESGTIIRPNVIEGESQGNLLTIDVSKKQVAGETVYLYLTFKVNNDESGKVTLGDKTNDVQIASFITYYANGTILPHYGENNYEVSGDNMIAGRIDKDSIPSNYDKEKGPQEDDEDKAPALNVTVTPPDLENGGRVLSGTVWEDKRNINVNDAIIGNGLKEDSERKIEGIRVQLIELVPTGESCRWAETTTDSNGIYKFTNIVAGDYVVRFIYGEEIDASGNKVASTYNGQDYKSTLYQVGVTQEGKVDADGKYSAYIDTNNQNESNIKTTQDKKYGYDIAKSEGENISDAKDVWTNNSVDIDVDREITQDPSGTKIGMVLSEKEELLGRYQVNDYSDNDVTNHTAEVLASLYEIPSYDVNGSEVTEDINALRQELIENTKMTAETGVIVMEIQKNTQTIEGESLPEYAIEQVDFGLVERPKAQLEIDKSIINLRLVLANGSVLFDVNENATVEDFIWQQHTEYNLRKFKENLDGTVSDYGKYEENYNDGIDRYQFRHQARTIIAGGNDNGLIQITMDEEIMHGAAIQITYKVKVSNVGEVDYEGTEYYYLGTNPGNVVTTTPNQVVDYVANNLQFYDRTENEGWEVISKETLLNEGLVNANLTSKLAEVNNVIQTQELAEALEPGQTVEKTLILSQLITAENEENDLTYSNMVEIVKTSNTVGRRMAYSVVGNQDPTALRASEVDSSLAERVIILPPFGETHIYYILGAVIALILIGGITLIIKKVVKK